MAQPPTPVVTGRAAGTARFYDLLDQLEARVGGARVLADCSGRMNWPRRGVYFSYENGEIRSGLGGGRRIVRVGTHAITDRSRTSLWNRLSQHRGSARSGGGNHRGSIFRLLVGTALARRGDLPLPPSWGVASDLGTAARRLGVDRAAVKQDETSLEALVSRTIGVMPFLWLSVDDAPGRGSQRGAIERNAIALLSGYREPTPDPPSCGWLGLRGDRDPVRRSGLWNNRHVDETYNPPFLDLLEERIGETQPL